jgi:hypothetical protein
LIKKSFRMDEYIMKGCDFFINDAHTTDGVPGAARLPQAMKKPPSSRRQPGTTGCGHPACQKNSVGNLPLLDYFGGER